MTEPSRAVFLSYASQDADAAQRICDALRTAGIDVWFDQSELRGGDAWDQTIRQRIRECELFIPVISAHSEARREGYFRREWKLACDRTEDLAGDVAFLVPVVIDETPSSTARVPPKFREVQWTRLPAGSTPAAFVDRIRALMQEEAAKWSEHPSGVPGAPPQHLQVSVSSRRPSRRMRYVGFASAVTVVLLVAGYALRRPSMPAAAAPAAGEVAEKSVAVLPFVDLSEKQDQGYFADGMAEEVIDLLAKVPGLRVIGRTSSFQFRGKSLDTRAIGAALQVSYLVEGSVRRSGARVRITAQLINANDARDLWSDTFEGQSDDTLRVQDSIASGIARALEIAVGTIASPGRPSTPEAHDLYMQGRQALDVGSQEGCQRAIGLLNHVLEIDPSSVSALIGLGQAYGILGEEGWMRPGNAFEKERQFAAKALQLDPRNSGAHVLLAHVHLQYDWNWAQAEQEISAAFNAGRRDAWALAIAAQIASARGQWDRATPLVREALAQDPLDPTAHEILGYYVYVRQGRYAEGEAPMRRALQISPTWGSGRYFLAVSLLMQERYQEALDVAQQELPQDGKYQISAEALFAMHRKAESDAALQKAIKQSEGDWPVSIAKVYAFRGERDQAIDWLERAYKYHDEDLWFTRWDPQLRSLEDDPRYQQFLRKMHLLD